MRSITGFLSRKFTISIIGIVVAGGGVVWFISGGNQELNTVAVARGTIISEVTVTGKTKPAEAVTLAFERSGRIVSVNAAVGGAVTRGQTLLALDASELAADLAQAEASHATQLAKLDELRRGARPEDIQVKQTELAKAEQDLANEYADAPDALQGAYNDADTAVRETVDELFVNDNTENVRLSFAIADSQLAINTANARLMSGESLAAWGARITKISSASPASALEDALRDGAVRLAAMRDFFNMLFDAAVNGVGISTSTLGTYKTAVTTARTSIASAIISVNAQTQALASQKVTVQRIADELALKRAGADPQQIAAQEAQVKQAAANVAKIQAQLAKTMLLSPLDGVVTVQDGKRGEIAAANAPLVSVISKQKLEIEANVAEADVAKVSVNNIARITFDAFGEGIKFSGRVAAIDPAETMIDGVPTYKINIQLEEENPAIKPGLTANIDITTARHENTLLVPQRAITYRNEKKFVSVADAGGNVEEREVTTGIRGSDGMIEILMGLAEGEEILP